MATENRILTVTFDGETIVKSDSLWQWDTGQVLKFADLDLPSTYEVHFSNNPLGVAETQLGNADGVSIPDKFLEKAASVFAWIYLHDTSADGETEYRVEIPVNRRAKPVDYVASAEDQSTFSQMFSAMSSAIASAQANAESIVRNGMSGKVDKVAGKGLSTNDFTDAQRNKLDSVESGAEKNVNADWNATSGDAQILNKPTGLVRDASYVHTDNNFTTGEKNKLAGIEAGATKTIIDANLSNTSQNPVRNSTVKAALDQKLNTSNVDANISFVSSNPIQNKTVAAALNDKVDKVDGKTLTSNDFTTFYKTKLDGVESGANRTVVDAALNSLSSNPVQNRVIKAELDKKLSIEEGKALSEQNFTSALKAKLEGIEQGAQKNVQADWNATTGDSFIKNKPLWIVEDPTYVHTDENFSHALKVKLDGIEPGATKTTVDETLSSVSKNPVQNKAVYEFLKRFGVGISFTYDNGTFKIFLVGPDGKQLGGSIPIGSAETVMVYDVQDTVTEFGDKPVKTSGLYAALRALQYDLVFDESDYSIHLINPDGQRVGDGAIIGDSKIAYKYAEAAGYTGTDEEYYNLLYSMSVDFQEVMSYHDAYFVGTTLYMNRGRFAGTTLFI